MKKLFSVFTDDMDHCIFTGSTYVERHHIFGGSSRKFSEMYGFVVPLRYDLHPNGVRFARNSETEKIDPYLKTMAQTHFEENTGNRTMFRELFGKSWL